MIRRTDGRRDLLEVTGRGRAASELWQDRCHQMEEVLLRDFTPEERERFADYLSRAYRNIQQKQTNRLRLCRQENQWQLNGYTA